MPLYAGAQTASSLWETVLALESSAVSAEYVGSGIGWGGENAGGA